jgi:hypothetical protein
VPPCSLHGMMGEHKNEHIMRWRWTAFQKGVRGVGGRQRRQKPKKTTINQLWVEHNNQPMIVKVSGPVRTKRASELVGVGEDGGAGRGGMKPIPLTKLVGRHKDNDNNKK